MKAILTIDRLDKDFRLLERRQQPSRSFTIGLLRLLYVHHSQVSDGAPYSMPDITNTARDVDLTKNYTYHQLRSNLLVAAPGGGCGMPCPTGQFTGLTSTNISEATLAGDIIGIQVGTNNTAVTPTDYKMNTRVAHGDGAGQLEYGGCEIYNKVVADPNASFDIRRYFNNQSGGDIGIQEVGIYSVGSHADSGSGRVFSFLICRDVVALVTVADTELLRVVYTTGITV